MILYYFRFIANVFASIVLSTSYPLFTTYAFSLETVKKFGSKRGIQRFETCVAALQQFMRPALEAIVAVDFYDHSVQRSATEFVKLAVSDSIDHISNIIEDDTVPKKTRDLMVEKLKSVKLWVMFPDDILNVNKIDKLYKEFDFNDSDNYIELHLNMLRQYWKLRTRPNDDEIKILQTIIKEGTIHYFADVNVLSKCDISAVNLK